MVHRRREALLSTKAESAATEVNQMKRAWGWGGQHIKTLLSWWAGRTRPHRLLWLDLCLLSCLSTNIPLLVRPLLKASEANGLGYTPFGSGTCVFGDGKE